MKMPFGRYRSWEVEALPDDYIRWLLSIDLREPLLTAVKAESVRRFGQAELAFTNADKHTMAMAGKIVDVGYRELAKKQPDANALVISDKGSSGEPSSLYLLAVETGEKRRLTFPPGKTLGDSSPSFSPDGKTLAFTRIVDGEVSDLYLLTISEGVKPQGEPKRLTFSSGATFNPVWTPSGQEIVFSKYDGSWRIATSGSSPPQRLASVGEEGPVLDISRQGNRLVYARSIDDSNIWRLELPGPKGKISLPAAFISSTWNDDFPQFSTDGRKIAFRSNRSGSQELWVCDSDGSNIMKLTSLGGPDLDSPRWSPDGERIAFDSQAHGNWDVYIVNANGGKAQRLTTNPANDGPPSWSHDGKWIYFDSSRTGEAQVWKIPANGGAEVQITRKGGFAPLESADGRFLYYAKRLSATSVWKVPVDGGEEFEIFDSLSFFANMALVPDGIYFIPTRRASKGFSVQFFDFVTGKIKTIITSEKTEGVGLTVSPDARWILYSQVDQTGSDLMLVENFR
jgi:Tol biopolymer transport system component